MLLAIDVGNTQTVIGLYESSASSNEADAGLLDFWRIATDDDRTSDEHAVIIRDLVRSSGHKDEFEGIAICSGVPRVLASLREMVGRYMELEPVVIEPGVRTGMSILYDNPREVGADRIANAVAAFDLYGGPSVVVDFGTGNNFDVISSEGEFLGGAIAPGIEISLDALFERAAALRAIELTEPRSVIGKSTVESLQSGAIYGFASQVDGMIERFREELSDCTVIATGGLAHLIAPVATSINHVEPFLTLHGLRLVYDLNRGDNG
jgi:type III pantothenate kinase